MKKLYNIILSVLAVTFLFSACNVKDFGDINKDPNNPSTAFTNYLFTEACTYVPRFVLGNAENGYDPWQQEWTGYISESKNNQYGPLSTTVQWSDVGGVYLYALRNLNQIIEMNEDPEQKDLSNVGIFGSNDNQIAVAKTLSAFFYMSVTDIVGPIVMSEAFKGKSEDNWTPKYDPQDQVYKQLDDMLKDAYAKFDENEDLDGAADVLYGGDVAKWKKFNASIRMLLAIKMCDVDAANGKARFAAAYADGGMETAADSFMYTYDDLYWNRLYYWVSPDYSGAGFNAVPNKFIVDQMKELKDDRMWAYFDIEGYRGSRKESIFPRDQYTSFYGVPFGLSSNDAVNAWVDCCASINSKLIGMEATIPVIPAARVLLTEAEAAYRGWISADAKALYEAGIKASFDQWGVSGADKYVASPAVAYNASKGLEQIAIQRWIASYMSDGVEAWSDWRRLDIPKMPVGPGAHDNGVTHYPYRLRYYTDYDVAYNTANYEEAVKLLRGGVDDTNSRLWWDVEPNWEGVLSEDDCVPSVVIPADWQVEMEGTYYYFGSIPDMYVNESPLGVDFFGVSTMETKLWKDANHPTEYKISPFGDGTAELFLSWDATTETFFIGNQIVGTYNGHPINVADRDTDQDSDGPYRGEWDPSDGCLYLYLMYRQDGPRNGVNPLLQYGYEVFEPKE